MKTAFARLLAFCLILPPTLHAREAFSELPITPASEPITLDGDLGEWATESMLSTCFDTALLPRYAASVMAMFDAKALYLAARFHDETPMQNVVTQANAQGHDGLRLLFVNDAALPYPLPLGRALASVRRISLWYDSLKQEPVLSLDHGATILRGKASGVVFRKTADNTGYTLEARIPWKYLTKNGKAPEAGASLSATIEPSWATPDGKMPLLAYRDVVRAGAGLGRDEPAGWGQARFYKAGEEGAILATINKNEEPLILSANIPDAQATTISPRVLNASGRVVRHLPIITREPGQTSAELTLRWDGRDNQQQPLPPGEYRLDLLTNRGISQRFIASLHNSGNPPWQTDDGRGAWLGDWSTPIAAAASGTALYLASAVAEAGSVLIGLDASSDEPQKLWGIPHIHTETTRAIAAEGERVYMLTEKQSKEEGLAFVRAYSAKEGRLQPFGNGKPVLELPRRSLKEHPGRWNVGGIAVRGGVLASSHHLTSEVVLTDLQSAETQARIPMKEPPTALAYAPGGELFVTTKHDLWKIAPGQRTPERLASGVFDEASGIAIAPQGEVYVSDQGKAMQVKVFTPEGKPLRTIGTQGGRPPIGKYDAKALYNPAGLAVDAKNRLWVAESDVSPRRISVWEGESGKLLHDFHGPAVPQNDGFAQLDEPELINVHHVLYHLDYETGAITPKSVLWRPHLNGWTPVVNYGTASRYIFRKLNGITYALLDHGYADRYATILRFDGEKLIPLASYGRGAPNPFQSVSGPPDKKANPEELLSPEALAVYWDKGRKQPKNIHAMWHQWSDLNDDGILQPEELVIREGQGVNTTHVDETLAFWGIRGRDVFRISPERFTPSGIPIYPPMDEVKPLFSIRTASQYSILPDPDGTQIYVMEQIDGTARERGRYAALASYDMEGNLLWDYPLLWPAFASDAPIWKPGYVIGADKHLGVVKRDDGMKFILTNGYYGDYHLLTSQGQWVATLCTDGRLGPEAGPNTIFIENFTGQIYRHPRTGKYYLLGGDIDRRVWELDGFDAVRTATTPFTLSPSDHLRARTYATRQTSEPSQGGDLAVSPIANQATPVWEEIAPATTLSGANGQRGTIRLAYNAQKLFARFDVYDSSPMMNTGDDEGLLFKTGDTCEIMLGMNPEADPHRSQPVPGDLRLLFSEKEGTPIAIISEAVSTSEGTSSRTYTSPTGEATFARVEPLSQAQLKIERTENGYVLEATIPWSALGQAPTAGATLRGDLGILFSNEGGSRTVQRLYHANKRTQTINDVPSESRLTPQSWTTLRFN